MKVIITGGSGLIGSELASQLVKKGYEVAILGRKSSEHPGLPYQFFSWDIENEYIDEKVFDNSSVIVHLAGANISEKRWSIHQKMTIEKSRVKSTELLYKTCKRLKKMPNAFISSSAIGYYGTFTSNKVFSETDSHGEDFLAQIGKKWEDSADMFEDEGVRTVKIRTGVVLSNKGAAYVKMSKAVKFGLAAAFGSGSQYVPWIHIDDIVSIFIKSIEDDKMYGAYNGVSPNSLNNKELIKAIAKSLKKPYFMPNIPEFIIRSLFGEMSSILLKGSRVSANKILEQGFVFQYPDIKSALENLKH